jgi:hypothetical protein
MSSSSTTTLRPVRALHLIVAAKAGGAKEAHGFVLDLPEDCCE